MTSDTPISVLIAAHARPEMLARTLSSLADADQVSRVDQVVVVENGGQQQLDAVVDGFSDRLPVRYDRIANANKSMALNHGLDLIAGGLVILLDDDILVDSGLIRAYLHAMTEYPKGAFFGGPITVDYETPPETSLLPFMTASTKGWSLGVRDRWLGLYTAFLGFNWAAYHNDLMEIGGFDPFHGPGSAGGLTGQESDAQRRLMARGIRGRYVAAATVSHHVSASQIDPDWIVSRRERAGRELARFVDKTLPRWLPEPIGRMGVRGAILIQRLRFLLGNGFSPNRELSRRWWQAYRRGALYEWSSCSGGEFRI
ncbi:glycosyltransferase [Stieleria varia]|uniref:Glycosyl transferase family 2 n=1 Tax=Stieleria varia TaxID=2528005 RepID=A0A5C6B7P5_9BACT|nr:glycosyltransferase [Stieleria varia]TWU07970.1 Glycosyl transferase family 2 [Stieleria varia]